MISDREAQAQAALLGMSAWQVEAVAVARDGGHAVSLKCIGFSGIGLALAEEETWEEALRRATRLVFSA